MGIVPPPLILFRRKRQETKDERPPLQGYGDNLQGSDGEASPFPVYYRSPVVPPSGPGGIERIPRGPQVNPDIITEYGRPPRPQVDPDLIGDYYL